MFPLRLGYFQDFKGSDTVLLCGVAQAFEQLAVQLADFVASDAREWAVHEQAVVSARHPVRLFATRLAASPSDDTFYWSCGFAELPSIQASLSALAASAAAHEYFALGPSATRLLVSVGEYPESWWLQHG